MSQKTSHRVRPGLQRRKRRPLVAGESLSHAGPAGAHRHGPPGLRQGRRRFRGPHAAGDRPLPRRQLQGGSRRLRPGRQRRGALQPGQCPGHARQLRRGHGRLPQGPGSQARLEGGKRQLRTGHGARKAAASAQRRRRRHRRVSAAGQDRFRQAGGQRAAGSERDGRRRTAATHRCTIARHVAAPGADPAGGFPARQIRVPGGAAGAGKRAP